MFAVAVFPTMVCIRKFSLLSCCFLCYHSPTRLPVFCTVKHQVCMSLNMAAYINADWQTIAGNTLAVRTATQ